MKRQAMLATLLLTVLMLAPVVPAEGQSSSQSRDQVYCPDSACSVVLQASVTVERCNASTCDVTINTTTVGSTNYPPGLLYSAIWVSVASPNSTSAGVCVGPNVVSDALEPYLPCGRVCEKYGIGTVIACRASIQRTVYAHRGGDCSNVSISDAFVWNNIAGYGTSLLFSVCQDESGNVQVFPWWGGYDAGEPAPDRQPPPFPTRPARP